MSNKSRNRQTVTPMTKTETITEESEISNEQSSQETTEKVIQESPVEVAIETQEKEEVIETPKETPTEEPVKVTESVPVAKSSTQDQKGFKPVYKVEFELNNYAEAMKPSNPIDPEEGGRWQYSLFAAIKSILSSKSQEDFMKEWNTLLNYFNKNKDGIFNENFIFRFPETWPGSANEYTLSRRILYTIIQTADPKTRRKAIAEINLALVTEGMTEDQKNKFLAFYD